jgi:hypothetical protein
MAMRGASMPRGKLAEVGETRVAQNGYHYTKTENGWRLTHHITAEKMLGRPLEDNEMVQFIDPKYKRDPYNEKGIKVIKQKTSSLRKRKAVIEQRIEELKAELRGIDAQLEKL